MEGQLGRQFSTEATIQQCHKLIQDGPHKYLHHLHYMGILTFFLGISAAFRSLLTIALAFFLFAWRIGAEEA